VKEKLEAIAARYLEVQGKLSDPEVLARPHLLRDLAREESDLSEIVQPYQRFLKVERDIEGDEKMIEEGGDEELVDMARAELEELKAERDELEEKLKWLLIPKDPQDTRNAIIEIRAGAGGDEAGLFAGDLYRMYQYYA